MTLVIMAAGMGSRYGGLKQLDPLGPGGEFLLDYSIYDAVKAGFNKVVFVIKKENLELHSAKRSDGINRYPRKRKYTRRTCKALGYRTCRILLQELCK